MEEEVEEDRISQLPDPILQHIISFVDIKQAVQTAILSTRWQNLWLSLSDLDFNFTRLAVNGGVNLKSWQARRAFSHLFINFINHFLSRRDGSSTTRKFYLSLNGGGMFDYDSDANAAFMEKCVDYAINHGVEELHLDDFWNHHPSMKFPAAFFASRTLRELKLRPSGGGNNIHIPKRLSSLPHLKTLHLHSAVFIDDDDAGFHNYSFTLEPFSGYPGLESLTLSSCRINGLVISGPNLVSLEIYEGNERSPRVKEINCPRLTSFKYEGYSPLSCSNVKFPVLEKAYVNIPRYRGFKPSKWTTSQCISLLHQLGNAKIVTLTLDTIKALEKDRRVMEQTPSPFPNMKCLKLRKGRREIPTVPQRVMNYLTKGCLCGDSLVIGFPEGVSVTEIEYLDYLFDEDGDEPELGCLFQMEDDPQI